MSELMIAEPLKGIEPSKAKQIRETFEPMTAMLDQFEGAYEEVMAMEQAPEKCAKAKRLRLDIAKIRTDADKERKRLKEEYLRGGNAVQGVFNILKFAVTDKEEKLKDVETYYERIEEEKRQKLHAERAEVLDRLGAEYPGIDLGAMDEAVWKNFHAGAKASYDARIAAEKAAGEERLEKERIEKEYQARRDQIAPFAQFGSLERLVRGMPESEYQALIDEVKNAKAEHDAEQERVRKENERLAAENAEREKQLAAERKKREAEERKRKEAEAAERKRKADEAAAEKARLSAPDKEKLLTLAKAILDTGFATEEAKAAAKRASRVLHEAAEAM